MVKEAAKEDKFQQMSAIVAARVTVRLLWSLPYGGHNAISTGRNSYPATFSHLKEHLTRMNYKIEEVEGIGPTYGKKLSDAGVATTGALLTAGATRGARKKLAETTGISDKLILEWCNLADLMRVKGIGKQYAELLEAAGVDTIKELRKRKAGNTAAKMKEVNAVKKLARTSPSESMVARWIEAAKAMEPSIKY